MKPIISVVIPSRDPGKSLKTCLDALYKSSYQNFECIVVIDSPDNSNKHIKNYYPIQLIQLDNNYGPSYARNKGVKQANSNLIFFIDDDVEVYPDTIDRIIKVFQNNPQLDAIFGSYDDQPKETNFISQYKNLFHHFIHQTSSENINTFWTGCGAIKKCVFEKVNGFNENYNYVEGIELGFRLYRNNYHIRLIKDLQVKHLKKWTFGHMIYSDIFHRGVPWTLIMLRFKNITNSLNLNWSSRFSAMCIWIIIISAILGLYSKIFVIASALFFVLFLALNMKSYLFYCKKRGIIFALRVIPLNILYYIYSSLSLLMGTRIYYQERIRNKFK